MITVEDRGAIKEEGPEPLDGVLRVGKLELVLTPGNEGDLGLARVFGLDIRLDRMMPALRR